MMGRPGSSRQFRVARAAAALARPRVNQRQVRDISRTDDRVLHYGHEIDRAKCLADRFFFSAMPGIKSRNLSDVALIQGPLNVPLAAHFFMSR